MFEQCSNAWNNWRAQYVYELERPDRAHLRRAPSESFLKERIAFCSGMSAAYALATALEVFKEVVAA